MGSKKSKNKGKKFYVVIGGRDGVPAIYESWACAHPKVTGVSKVEFEGFYTLDEAKSCIESRGIFDFKIFDEAGKEVDGKEADNTPPQPGVAAYYAVACGENAGVKPIYYNGAEPEVNKYSGSCHKRFETLPEAEAFIENWRNGIAVEYYKAIRKLLDEGIVPKGMNIEERARDMLLKDYKKKGNDKSVQQDELKQQEIVEGVGEMKLEEPSIKQE